jgi:hypothetical protein
MEVKLDSFPQFSRSMGEAVEILKSGGWRLVGAYLQRTGRLNTVIHIWEAGSLKHYDEGVKNYVSHPNFPDIKKQLDESMISETIVLAKRMSYAPSDTLAAN